MTPSVVTAKPVQVKDAPIRLEPHVSTGRVANLFYTKDAQGVSCADVAIASSAYRSIVIFAPIIPAPSLGVQYLAQVSHRFSARPEGQEPRGQRQPAELPHTEVSPPSRRPCVTTTSARRPGKLSRRSTGNCQKRAGCAAFQGSAVKHSLSTSYMCTRCQEPGDA